MKIAKIFIVFLPVLAFFFIFIMAAKNKNKEESVFKEENAGNMQISSQAFKEGKMIPQKYTCDGENVSPPLEIGNLSEKAESLVLIVEDPDAPAGTFIHWIVVNINPKNPSFGENSPPKGALEIENSFGKKGYGGPCPPSGQHRYFFRIYALDVKLAPKQNSGINEIKKDMAGHVLDESYLMGLYSRK